MTELVGILNLTPDSFSGDGLPTPEKALARIDAMIEEGAHVIDIGAESTRPGATALTPEDEWERLAPVAEALGKKNHPVRFSVDTRHVEVARRALDSGFHWINDVSGGRNDGMLELAGKTGCTIVLMHSVTIPADPERMLPKDAHPLERIHAFGEHMLSYAQRFNLKRSQIILDPGIGFGKTREQSMVLLKNIGRLKFAEAGLMVGHSRKSFLSLFTDRPSVDRDAETLAVSYYLASQNVGYLRVHDLKGHAAMLRIHAALEGK